MIETTKHLAELVTTPVREREHKMNESKICLAAVL